MKTIMFSVLFGSLLISNSYAGTVDGTIDQDAIVDGPVQTQSIRVATYNTMASRHSKSTIVLKAIKSIHADIIALEEIDNKTARSGKNSGLKDGKPINQPEFYAKKLGMHYIFCKTIDFDGGEYGTALLSKYPIKLVKRIPLPNAKKVKRPQDIGAKGGFAEARSACVTSIQVPGYPAPIGAIVTHLANGAPNLNLVQAKFLDYNVNIDKFSFIMPIIFGDLNMTPKSASYKAVTEHFNPTDKDLTYTSPAVNPHDKIDYILTSTAQKWKINQITIPRSSQKIDGYPWYKISDHLPYIVDMHLTEK